MSWRSEFFTLEELTVSDTAVRHGIDNMPTGEALKNLEQTAVEMDAVRRLLGKPVIASSGYRAPKLNVMIGGSATSDHPLGYAVDFRCPAYGTPQVVARRIRDSGIKYDQLIYEGTWVHISFNPRKRQQCLTAHFGTKTTYTVGI